MSDCSASNIEELFAAVTNLPDRNSEDNACQLQLANLIQLRIALSARRIDSQVAEDHTACSRGRTMPEVERATPGSKDNPGNEHRPDEKIDNAFQDRMH
jgi:hypothetical protein